MSDLAESRRCMVERQLAARGIRDAAVLAAMGKIPREEFVAPELVEFAYEDAALPIAEEQTISQPYIVALMVEALELAGEDRVLEIGTGSGYAAAVLSRVVSEVYTVERHDSLARSATDRIRRLSFSNVHVRQGDGTLGWPEHAPYDAILVSAGGPEVPRPLLEQLAVGGRLVIPVGHQQRLQKLMRITRTSPDALMTKNLGLVQFVPLIGAAGWQSQAPNVHQGLPDTFPFGV